MPGRCVRARRPIAVGPAPPQHARFPRPRRKGNHHHRSPPSSASGPQPASEAGASRVHQRSAATPSVSLGSRQAIHLPQSSIGGGNPRTVAGNEGELPPPVRSTGGGGSPRLRGETEGAQAKPTVISGSVNLVHAFPAKAGTQLSSEECVRRTRLLDPRLRGGCVSKDRAAV